MKQWIEQKRTACWKYFALFVIMLLFITACGKKERKERCYQIPEEKKLIVYTAHKEEVYGPIIKEFEERTGIFVEVLAGDTIELFEKVAGSERGACDVMFGGGVENFIECRQFLEPYEVKEKEQIKPEYLSEDNSYTPFSALPIVFVYNNKLVYPVAAPKTWAELQTNRWEGKVAFADPAKSGSSYTALCTMLQALGKDKEQSLLHFSNTLAGKLSADSLKVLDEVDAGTRLVGITIEGTARKRILEGADLTMVYPADGTSAIPDGTAIIKGAPHLENARRFLDFTVSRDVQRLVEDSFFRRTVRSDITPEDVDAVYREMKLIPYDFEWAAGKKEEILSKWGALWERYYEKMDS